MVAAVIGSTGAGATPQIDAPLLAFDVEPGFLGLCATDLQGHTFRLTDPGLLGARPTWSPDGSRLAFMARSTTLQFVDAEGIDRGSLWWPSGDGEHTSSRISGFAWSPDNRMLAVTILTAFKYGGVRSELWVNGDGSRPVYSGGMISSPSWSPNGTRIAFSDSFTRKAYVIDANGQNLHEVLDFADGPVWSPDGQKLAYVVVDADNRSVGLAVAGADGSGQQKLTAGKVLSPTWSPDSGTIAFTRLGTSARLEVIKPDGTDGRVIAAEGWGPAWSPDGSAIAFGTQEEPAGIHVVNTDGTNERVVETGLPGAVSSSAAWRRPAPLPTHRRRCVIAGTPRAEVLRGKNRGDVLYGGGGDDTIHAAGGDDVIIGGPGHDRLFGGDGNDFFMAKDGRRDHLFGGAGKDVGAYDVKLDRHKSVEYYVPSD